jgi:osmoprotectant transport system ATP-binding protein
VTQCLRVEVRSVPSEPSVPLPSTRAVSNSGVTIEFHDVRFAYGATRVLDDVRLVLETGTVGALVGRSGMGKTTVLKLVNRIRVPDAGTVKVGGRDTREWDPIQLRRQTGYVIQDAGLLPHLTVAQNVGLVPRLEGWAPDRIRARTEDLLQLVQLSFQSFADRFPHELSGGQRQRIAIARALAADPPILLMDEPFGALDAITRAELRREFLRIQRELRKTVMLVTHDISEALALSDRVGVLEGGRLVAWESPSAILRSEHPGVRPFLDALPVAAPPP